MFQLGEQNLSFPTNQVLSLYPTFKGSVEGRYVCTARNRLDQEVKKEFVITSQAPAYHPARFGLTSFTILLYVAFGAAVAYFWWQVRGLRNRLDVQDKNRAIQQVQWAVGGAVVNLNP